MRMCHFRVQNSPICIEKKKFGTNHYYCFRLHIRPFDCAKFLKNDTANPELRRCVIFAPKKVHLARTNFFEEIINTILIYLLASFIEQNLKKKIIRADPEL